MQTPSTPHRTHPTKMPTTKPRARPALLCSACFTPRLPLSRSLNSASKSLFNGLVASIATATSGASLKIRACLGTPPSSPSKTPPKPPAPAVAVSVNRPGPLFSDERSTQGYPTKPPSRSKGTSSLQPLRYSRAQPVATWRRRGPLFSTDFKPPKGGGGKKDTKMKSSACFSLQGETKGKNTSLGKKSPRNRTHLNGKAEAHCFFA